MKINRNFIAVLFLIPLFLVGCINDDLNNVNEDLTNAEIMKQLKISDVAIWNTLTTQSIDLSTLKSSNLKSGQGTQMDGNLPANGQYYFSLFEDLYPSEGDYDFNDIIIKSRLDLSVKKDEISGTIYSEMVNKGGSLPVEIGLMFYEVSGKKYTRIANENITINGVTLTKGAGPWTTPYSQATHGKPWQIEYKFINKSANVWIAYHIVTVKGEKRTEILTSGFAQTSVTTPFEVPTKDFISDNDLPWGLEITAQKFAIPNEKVLFLKAYPEFQKWVETGSGDYKRWYENPDLNYSKY